MRNNKTIKNLKNYNVYTNRFKETIRNLKDLPDIVRTQDYEGLCYASYGMMRMFIFERALKLRNDRSGFLRDFGLKDSDIGEKTVIDLEYYVVEQTDNKEIEHFIKSELKINQKNWQVMKKIHLAQAKHLEKDLKIKFYREEAEKAAPFSVKEKELYPVNFHYRSREIIRSIWGVETEIHVENFPIDDYQDVKSMMEAARNYHFGKVEPYLETNPLLNHNGLTTRIFQLQLIEHRLGDEKQEIVHSVLDNYLVYPNSPVIEDSFTRMPRFYDAAWQEAKRVFHEIGKGNYEG